MGFNIVRVCNTNSKSMVLAVMTVYTRALLGPKGFVSSGNTYGHVGPNMVTVAAWFGQW